MNNFLFVLALIILSSILYSNVSYGEVRTPHEKENDVSEKIVTRNVCSGSTINWTIPSHAANVSLAYKDRAGNPIFNRTFSVSPNYSIHLKATK